MGFLLGRTGAKPYRLSVTPTCESHNLLFSQSHIFSPLQPADGSLARDGVGLHHH